MSLAIVLTPRLLYLSPSRQKCNPVAANEVAAEFCIGGRNGVIFLDVSVGFNVRVLEKSV